MRWDEHAWCRRIGKETCVAAKVDERENRRREGQVMGEGAGSECGRFKRKC